MQNAMAKKSGLPGSIEMAREMVIETCGEYRNDSWNRYKNNYPSYPLIEDYPLYRNIGIVLEYILAFLIMFIGNDHGQGKISEK